MLCNFEISELREISTELTVGAPVAVRSSARTNLPQLRAPNLIARSRHGRFKLIVRVFFHRHLDAHLQRAAYDCASDKSIPRQVAIFRNRHTPNSLEHGELDCASRTPSLRSSVNLENFVEPPISKRFK